MTVNKMERLMKPSTQQVLRILRDQDQVYDRLERCAKLQQSSVSDADVERLLSVLADREKLIHSLAKSGKLLDPVRREWKAFRDEFSPVDRQEAEALLDRAETRLQKLIRGDEQDARVLAGRKEAAADALRATHATGRALSAYQAQPVRTGRLDCVDETSS